MGYYNNHNNSYGHHPHGGNSTESHQTLLQKLLRALISIVTSIGFALFWYAFTSERENRTFLLVVAITLMAIGVLHIFIGIKKDCDYRNRN